MSPIKENENLMKCTVQPCFFPPPTRILLFSDACEPLMWGFVACLIPFPVYQHTIVPRHCASSV